MRNWYEAICEDLGINLIALSKVYEGGISDTSLSLYKRTGQAPTRSNAIKGVVDLINANIESSDFTKTKLLDYFKKYKISRDQNKKSCIHAIFKTLNAVEKENIDLQDLRILEHKTVDEIPQWVYETLLQQGGYKEVGLFLEEVRGKITTEAQFEKARDLHDVIAPLAIRDTHSVSPSREEICSLKGIDNSSSPAMAGLSIYRAQGGSLPLKLLEDKESNEHYFPDPENAVIEGIFSGDPDDPRQRLARKLLIRYGYFSPSAEDNEKEVEDHHFDDLNRFGEDNMESLNQPYIYLKNIENAIGQLEQVLNFKGIHKFANSADNELEIFSRSHFLWLIGMYSQLKTIENGFEEFKLIRLQIAGLSNTGSHKELQILHNSGSNMGNKEYLDVLEKASTIAVNIPKIIQSGMPFFEKVSALLSKLPEIIKALGAS